MGELHPEPIVVEARTVAEAISSLRCIPELERDDGQPWPVLIDGITSAHQIYSPLTMDEIHVRPFESGSKNRGAAVGILIGVAMIGVGLAVGAGTILGTSITGHTLALAGGLTLLSGLMTQQMALQPEFRTEMDREVEGQYFAATQNTVKIGTPVPIAYGYQRLGGHYLSFNVDAHRGQSVNTPQEVRSFDQELLADDIHPPLPRYRGAVAAPNNPPTSGLLSWA